MKIQVELPGLCGEVTPAGNPRWRVRVEGKKTRKITIPVGPDHPDFQDHYDAARMGEKLKVKENVKPAKGTLDELCERFEAWMEIQVLAGNLSPDTVSSRRRGLRQACNCKPPKGKRMGDLKASMPLAAFVHIRDSFGTLTGAAATCLKALRAAYTWGVEHGYPEDCPVFKVKNTHRSKGGATPWTEDDKTKFLARHGPGTTARRWFFLSDDTAGRIGDTHTLGPKNEVFRDDSQYISWQPGKRGSQPVEVPMSADLMKELAGLPDEAPAYLLTEYGKPFVSSASLDNRVRKWIVEAGLVDENGKANRSQHGIRKRRAEIIAEEGGSVYEVMAHLSHSDTKTAAIYTKKIERKRLAERAARRKRGSQ